MPIPQQPPEEGGTVRHVQFRYVPTETGTQWKAYVAGKPHWFTAHTKRRTKPCLHVMTRGELICTRCTADNPARKVAYLPLYREVDTKEVMVILYEHQYDALAALTLHQRVIIGRENQQSDAVWVAPNPAKGQTFHSTFRWKYQNVDLTQSLLILWGLPELVSWYNATHGAGAKPMQTARETTEEVQPKKKRSEVSPMMGAAFERHGLLEPEALLPGQEETAETLALRRIQEQQNAHRANGKPKPR